MGEPCKLALVEDTYNQYCDTHKQEAGECIAALLAENQRLVKAVAAFALDVHKLENHRADAGVCTLCRFAIDQRTAPARSAKDNREGGG